MQVVKIERITHDAPVPVYDVIDAKPSHNFLIVGNTTNIVSHNCAVMDECNFSQAGIKDVKKAKARMRETYTTVAARVSGTFKHGGQVFGKIFACSSKRSDSDFMEDYVSEQINAGAGDHMYIADAPQWEVLPSDRYSKETFFITVGDRYKRGFIIPDENSDEAHLQE